MRTNMREEALNESCERILRQDPSQGCLQQSPLLPNTEKVEILSITGKPTGANTPKDNSNVQSSSSRMEKKLRRREKLSQPCGPENSFVIRSISSFLCLLVVWGIFYALLDKHALPGSKLLTLLALLAVAYAVGDIFKLFGLPKLLGMLLSGIVIRNTGFFFDTKERDTYFEVVSVVKQVALTSILITAGLELDAKSLKKLSAVVIELSLIPCIVEAIGVAVCCRYILGFSWYWGMLNGFVMGAVTPAIVVPALLSLQRNGYDPENKISTIVIAAASFDDIVAISGFGIFFGIIFNDGEMLQKILQGPVELLLGTLLGILWGVLSAWIPHPADRHVVAKRVFMIGGGGLFFVLGTPSLGYSGIGPLACMVAAFIACICWKWQGWSPTFNPVRDVFDSLWILLQPALFGLIGAEIHLGDINVSEVISALLIIGGGLVARTIACSAVLLFAKVTYKELVFINIAWLPKATVQAALGSLALDRAKQFTPAVPEEVESGRMTLIIAVLSILTTAPIGAIGINVFGRMLLKRGDKRGLNLRRPSVP